MIVLFIVWFFLFILNFELVRAAHEDLDFPKIMINYDCMILCGAVFGPWPGYHLYKKHSEINKQIEWIKESGNKHFKELTFKNEKI